MLKESMFINTTENYPEPVVKLLRMHAGFWTGGEIASLFYRHYVEDLTLRQMGYRGYNVCMSALYVIRASPNGGYAENKKLFDYCLKHYPEALDKLFKVETASV